MKKHPSTDIGSNNAKEKECYNSFSCIASVLIIVFILGSILYDMTITKPRMNDNIIEIKTELTNIKGQLNNVIMIAPLKIDSANRKDSINLK